MMTPETPTQKPALPKAQIPTRLEGFSPTEMKLEWNSGETFALPYFELRFECPCAGCVDEHTGRRTLQRTSISPTIKPVSASTVGQYALQITWTDGHQTGMYHFDRLFELCQEKGRKI